MCLRNITDASGNLLIANGTCGIVLGFVEFPYNHKQSAVSNTWSVQVGGRGSAGVFLSPLVFALTEPARSFSVDFFFKMQIDKLVQDWRDNNKVVPLVQFENGIQRAMHPEVWSYDVAGVTRGVRIQTPLKVSYAVTIHKSQGMTLSKVRRLFPCSPVCVVGCSSGVRPSFTLFSRVRSDAGRVQSQVEIHLGNVFAAGQMYVALSRVRSLDGLIISGYAKHKVGWLGV